MAGRTDQRGSAGLVVLVGTLALAVPAAAGLARLGGAAHRQARADAVADLTALAAAVDGRRGAERLVRANGATLVALDRARGVAGERTTVVVRSGGTSATAAAEARP